MAISDRNTPPNGTIANRAVPNFPTPVISDKILNEVVSTEVGDYTPLEYGVQFDAVEHTSFQGSYPGFQLVWQGPIDPNGFWVRRVWVNDRVDQEIYNFSISYMSENPAFPDITRVFVYPRDRYDTGAPTDLGPLPPLTPDTEFTDALLVSEQMINEVQPVELTSKYVKVVRHYQVIPGPVVITQDFDIAMNVMVSTARQIVLSSDEFDPTDELLTLALSESEISQYIKLRVWSYLEDLPDPFTEYRSGRMSFPALVFNITVDVLQLTLDPDRSAVRWFPDQKSAPQVPAIYQVETSYYTAPPSPPTLYAIPTRDLIYNGISFGINIGGVLNDLITVSASFSDDANFGDLTEDHTFAATDLTATEYLADIGTYQIVAYDIKRFRGNIWVLEASSVLII